MTTFINQHFGPDFSPVDLTLTHVQAFEINTPEQGEKGTLLMRQSDRMAPCLTIRYLMVAI